MCISTPLRSKITAFFWNTQVFVHKNAYLLKKLAYIKIFYYFCSRFAIKYTQI